MSIFINFFLCVEFYSKIKIDRPGYFVYNSNRSTSRLLTRASGLQTNSQTDPVFLDIYNVVPVLYQDCVYNGRTAEIVEVGITSMSIKFTSIILKRLVKCHCGLSIKFVLHQSKVVENRLSFKQRHHRQQLFWHL